MTQGVHRFLMFVGGVCAGFGGISGGTELIDPQLGAWIAFVGGLAIVVANQWRVSFPDTPAGDA